MVRRISRAALVLALLLGHAPRLHAQSMPGPGTRVRVTAPSQKLTSAEGTVQDTANGALVVQLGKPGAATGVRTFSRSDLSGLDTYAGRHRPVLEGGLIGLLAGAATGAIIGFASGDDKCSADAWFCMAYTSDQKAAMGAAGLGTLGLVVGLVVGALSPSDRWKPVPLDASRLAVRPTFNENGMGVSVRVPFGR